MDTDEKWAGITALFRELAEDPFMDEGEKLGVVCLAFQGFQLVPTEDEWRNALLSAGVNIYDPVVERTAKDATCMYYYGGLLELAELSSDTWIDVGNSLSFEGMTNPEFVEEVKILTDEASKFLGAADLV